MCAQLDCEAKVKHNYLFCAELLEKYSILMNLALMMLQDVRRIKWQQKWLPRYFYQHIYMPMLYCVVSPTAVIII